MYLLTNVGGSEESQFDDHIGTCFSSVRNIFCDFYSRNNNNNNNSVQSTINVCYNTKQDILSSVRTAFNNNNEA